MIEQGDLRLTTSRSMTDRALFQPRITAGLEPGLALLRILRSKLTFSQRTAQGSQRPPPRHDGRPGRLNVHCLVKTTLLRASTNPNPRFYKLSSHP